MSSSETRHMIAPERDSRGSGFDGYAAEEEEAFGVILGFALVGTPLGDVDGAGLDEVEVAEQGRDLGPGAVEGGVGALRVQVHQALFLLLGPVITGGMGDGQHAAGGKLGPVAVDQRGEV